MVSATDEVRIGGCLVIIIDVRNNSPPTALNYSHTLSTYVFSFRGFPHKLITYGLMTKYFAETYHVGDFIISDPDPLREVVDII